jgi:hypothetical protein
VTTRERDALDARRLWNYLRLMEVRKARLREVEAEADRLAMEGIMS